MRLVAFMDLETTGKFTPDHRIIELSLRLCDLESHEEKRNMLLRFNPDRNIDAKAFAVHGISLDELKSKPVIAKCLGEITKLLKQCEFVVAHNGDAFDFPFLKMEYERNNVEMPEVVQFDTMLEGNFASDLGKSPSLKELCWSLDVDYDDSLAHKGDYDTAILRDAFFKGVVHGWFIVD